MKYNWDSYIYYNHEEYRILLEGSTLDRRIIKTELGIKIKETKHRANTWKKYWDHLDKRCKLILRTPLTEKLYGVV